MNRNQLILIAAAIVATLAMVLYPPYRVALTGEHMGYYFVFDVPALVQAFGNVNMGRLLLQLVLVWGSAAALLLGLRTRQP